MAQTITCNKCHKTVCITDLQRVDFNEKYLSCGHIQRIDSKALLGSSIISQSTSSDTIICSKCNTVYTNDSEYLLHYKEKHKSEENENEKQVIKWYIGMLTAKLLYFVSSLQLLLFRSRAQMLCFLQLSSSKCYIFTLCYRTT